MSHSKNGSSAKSEQNKIPTAFYSNLDVSFQSGLVPVYENENGDLVCNALKLHQRLKTKTRFDNWIQRRIQDFDFQEGYDYCPKLDVRSDGKAGRKRINYELTIDMAKELAMVEKNDEGKMVRRYFIAVEKAFKEAIAKLYRPINGITPLHKDGKIGYPRKEFLISIGRSYKNGYRLRQQYAKDCFDISHTACISERLAALLADRYMNRQTELDLRTDKTRE